MTLASPYRAVLFDLEGTLYDSTGPLPGAAEAVASLRRAGLHVRFVTNTTRKSRATLVTGLREMGFRARPEELFTAVTAAAAWCRKESRLSVLPLLAREALADLEGLRIGMPGAVASFSPSGAGAGETAPGGDSIPRAVRLEPHKPLPGTPPATPLASAAPWAVIVGDLGSAWTYEALNVAFRRLQEGAELVACQKNRFWQTAEGLTLDAGPFVAALEYASGREAVIVGKPAAAFFHAALADLDIQPREAVMVGDDAEVDAGGAISAGLGGWLVRTGKYRPGDESRARPWPECVLDSVADLPEELGLT